VLPTATLPKAIEAGVAVRSATAEVVPVPLRSMTKEGSLALLVMETVAAVSFAAEVGLYVTVKLVVCPPASVIGVVSPLTLTPVPENASFEIDALSLPVFSNLTVCVASLPTATLPKAIEAGIAVNDAPVMPAPLRATIEGEVAALLAIVIAPVSALPTVGLNTAEIDALCPALSDSGRCGPEAVNPVPVTVIAETVSISVPLLVNVTVCVALLPIARFPKLTEVGDNSIVAPPVLGFVGLVVMPTQPEFIKITSRHTVPESTRRMDLRANRCERIASFTRAPSRMGARVITTRIVQRGTSPELLAEGTHLGQGRYPVREDSIHA
jgi:hypothetical protein